MPRKKAIKFRRRSAAEIVRHFDSLSLMVDHVLVVDLEETMPEHWTLKERIAVARAAKRLMQIVDQVRDEMWVAI